MHNEWPSAPPDIDLLEKVQKLYDECSATIEPMFPKVLVRLLPKEQRIGSIWVPDGAQNKPLHEGIVLKTYKPRWRSIYKTSEWYTVISTDTILDEDNKIQAIWQESAVQPGDHVLFPHMALGITPVWPLDGGKGDYRLVPEGEILTKLTYSTESIRDWLIKILAQVEEVDLSESLADTLLENADVVRKDLVSKTLSGR